MAATPNNPPLIVIVGETASGKTGLAIELAQQFNGEIIAADSRTIYKGMNIGTAKPDAVEQAAVPHHLIDVVNPDQPFTVADFKRLAEAKIAEITARGKIPFLVGGTGLYIDAVIYNFSFTAPPDPHEREYLQSLSVEELQALHQERGMALPENDKNPVHLIRSLERNGEIPVRHGLREHTLLLGLAISREALEAKLTKRVDAMVERGFIEEVTELARRYGWTCQALQAPGYKAFRPYLEGEATLEEAKHNFVRNDLQYAKRQRTWFRRNKSIHWLNKSADSVALVTTFLNK